MIWTRHRAEPDVTPAIRRWFTEAGFDEVAFIAPEDDVWAVGVARLAGPSLPLEPGQHWLTFYR